MRKDLLFAGAEKQHYEIRAIVEIARKFEAMGVKIYWENIGDPVAKGERLPQWMKEKIAMPLLLPDDDSAYGYCPTRGVDRTREFLAGLTNKRGRIRISPNDIIFFNGLGDAISTTYSLLSPSVRVIGPSPAYSTHSSAEAAHASSNSITYPLDPYNRWYPDLDKLRLYLEHNDSISGILAINPNNPTGAVYPREYLEEMVSLAAGFDQFLIFDEIYLNVTYNGEPVVPLSDIIGNVPGISMKGISKEWPWPGARCGWIEAYNMGNDEVFRLFNKHILDKKMLEVCSTTHPQMVIPDIMGDERYAGHMLQRNQRFRERAERAHHYLSGIEGVIVHKAQGAFYMTVMFEDGVLNENQSLPVDNADARDYVQKLTGGVAHDTRFVYNLLASRGICVVPLTTFDCNRHGFRVTLLESNEKDFEHIFKTLRESIIQYTDS